MLQALIGQKIDQTQKFLENGRRVPVTEVSVPDNIVVQVKTQETDKYEAVQLGWGTKKNPTKPAIGHSKKANLSVTPRILKEVQLQKGATSPEVGSLIAVETIFKPGDIISVSGVSKGKGFASAIKRYNFRGGPKTHGQSDRHRAPGSIGQGTTPGRVYKGKKMAGHMGHENVSILNLTVLEVDSVNKKLYVMGLVPGNKNANVVLTLTGEMKKFIPLLNLKKEAELSSVEEVSVEATSDVANESVESAPVVEAPKAEETPATQDAEVKEEVAAESGEAEVVADETETKEEVVKDETAEAGKEEDGK